MCHYKHQVSSFKSTLVNLYELNTNKFQRCFRAEQNKATWYRCRIMSFSIGVQLELEKQNYETLKERK